MSDRLRIRGKNLTQECHAKLRRSLFLSETSMRNTNTRSVCVCVTTAYLYYPRVIKLSATKRCTHLLLLRQRLYVCPFVHIFCVFRASVSRAHTSCQKFHISQCRARYANFAVFFAVVTRRGIHAATNYTEVS